MRRLLARHGHRTWAFKEVEGCDELSTPLLELLFLAAAISSICFVRPARNPHCSDSEAGIAYREYCSLRGPTYLYCCGRAAIHKSGAEHDVATVESVNFTLDLVILSCPHGHPHLSLSSISPSLQILKKVAIASFRFGDGESLTAIVYQPSSLGGLSQARILPRPFFAIHRFRIVTSGLSTTSCVFRTEPLTKLDGNIVQGRAILQLQHAPLSGSQSLPLPDNLHEDWPLVLATFHLRLKFGEVSSLLLPAVGFSASCLWVPLTVGAAESIVCNAA